SGIVRRLSHQVRTTQQFGLEVLESRSDDRAPLVDDSNTTTTQFVLGFDTPRATAGDSDRIRRARMQPKSEPGPNPLRGKDLAVRDRERRPPPTSYDEAGRFELHNLRSQH